MLTASCPNAVDTDRTVGSMLTASCPNAVNTDRSVYLFVLEDRTLFVDRHVHSFHQLLPKRYSAATAPDDAPILVEHGMGHLCRHHETRRIFPDGHIASQQSRILEVIVQLAILLAA